MRKGFVSIAVVAVLSAGALLATGCASEQGNAPSYRLAGRTDQAAEIREQRRFSDDKGHYRPDWRFSSDPDRYARFSN